MFKKFLIGILSLIFSQIALASCVKMRVVNGIGYNSQKQVLDLNSQIKTIFNEYSQYITIDDPLYNSGSGLAADAHEVYYLKWKSGEYTLDVFYQYIIVATISSVVDVLNNPFNPQYQNNKKRVDDELVGMISTVKADIDGGCYLILLGHSEGNLFIKSVLAQLSDSYKSKVVHYGLGAPTTMPGNSDFIDYRTSSRDTLINSVANSSSANFTSDNSLGGIIENHALLNAYLSNKNTGSASGYSKDVSATKTLFLSTNALEMVKFDVWRIYLYLTKQINHPPSIFFQ